MVPPHPRLITTPRSLKRSTFPTVISQTSRQRDHPLKTFVTSYHKCMDELIMNELGDATLTTVKGLPEVVFPTDGFLFPLEDMFNCLADEAPSLYDRVTKQWREQPSFDAASQEVPIANFFQALSQRAREIYIAKTGVEPEERDWSPDFRDTALPGGYMNRKPDIAALVAGLTQVWANLRVDVQHKANSHDVEAAAQQLHDGGFNSLSTQDERLYHLGLGVIGDELFIAYYDRAGYMRSTGINIHNDPLRFLRVLLGLTLLHKSYLGYDPTIEHDDCQRRFVTVNGTKYQILDRLNEHPGIRGLGTVCWLAKEADSKNKKLYVIKSFWVDTSRRHTEAEFLERAAAANVSGVPKLVAYEAVEVGGIPISTHKFRTELGYALGEERVYTRLVEEERGIPLSEFASKAELLSGLRDCVKTHLDLYNIGIIHGDIHDKNVMLNTLLTSSKGLRHGLLIDLNYGIDRNDREQPAVGQKSCPAAFMACELLRKPHRALHEYYHDLESFLYVLIWICVCYSGPDGQERTDTGYDFMNSELANWIIGDTVTIGTLKANTMQLEHCAELDTFAEFVDANFHGYFDDVKPCVLELRKVIMCTSPRPTHQQVIEILDKHIDVLLQSGVCESQENEPVELVQTFGALATASEEGDRVLKGTNISYAALSSVIGQSLTL
ncbi:hypothetical protein K525DRAFT_198180 [Schizophyllum commune Loenen D]|nr:hypothetical protein K525DRAFT_198180 [Schizophyllum commune Loenen D]